jgi:integrase/recombinase XerD
MRILADLYHGDAQRSFVEALEGWELWVQRRVRSKTVQRYACSLDQIRDFLDGKGLRDIDRRLFAEISRARSAAGVSNATIKRDLGALSSVLNFAVDQGWLESNPVAASLHRIEEKRAPITLPRTEDIEHVISCAPGMMKDVIRAAMAFGARQEELLNARRTDVDHERQQLTIVGKRDKRRTIALEPFGGYELVRALPAAIGSPFLFWHSAGERYQNFSSQFAAVVSRAAARAKAAGTDFRPFRFHDLRHWHAVQWLKSGRSIYELQHRLGHSSVKVTEIYLRAGYLSFALARPITLQTTGQSTGMPEGPIAPGTGRRQTPRMRSVITSVSSASTPVPGAPMSGTPSGRYRFLAFTTTMPLNGQCLTRA